MKGFLKKGALVLCGLLLSIAAVGQVFSDDGSPAAVPVVAEKVLVPGGQSVGVKMDVRGVLIVGLEEIEGKDGETVNPGLLSGLQIGDVILEINGTPVYRADEVQELVNEIRDIIRLKVKRNNETLSIEINPVQSEEDGL